MYESFNLSIDYVPVKRYDALKKLHQAQYKRTKELEGIIMDIEDRATINFDDKLLLFIKELKDGKSRRNLLYGKT